MEQIRKSLLMICVVCLAGCSGISRDPASLEDLQNPQVPGIEGARYWADVEPANAEAILEENQRRRRASGLAGKSTVLALSGGAEDGAFAAGILTAWSEAGTRPEFMTVTGVSTGALSAPFAFLGQDYDDELRLLYGGLQPSEVIGNRSIFNILPNASIKDTTPLKERIEEYLTDDFLASIAAEHRRGRNLVVESVSLDAQRPVLWDLGAIAASGAPNAKAVFRDALLASSAVPGVFPPVLIEVQTEVGIRDELHVDGGVIAQSAFLSGWRLPTRYLRGQTVYAIRNGKVTPEHQTTSAGIVAVSTRSLSTLIKRQGAQDLWNAYASAQERGAKFRTTWIRDDFTQELDQPFDPAYMKALFEYGYQRFKRGDLWNSKPPALRYKQ